MAVGSTQPLTEINIKLYNLGRKGGRGPRLRTLLLSDADCLEILEASTTWSPKGLSRSE